MSDALSDLFIQDVGSVRSKAPRNEAPNTINNKKKAMLKYTFVAILFKASAPKTFETPTQEQHKLLLSKCRILLHLKFL